MSELVLDGASAEIVRRNCITDEDVMMMRRTLYKDGIINAKEATSLMALDRSCREKCTAWDDFYVEALGDYLVFHTEPRSHISPDNAEFIMRAISVDGKVDSRTELRLLLYVMKKAHSVPDTLSAFALEQVKHAVLHGEGAMAKDRILRPGVVTADDVEMLKMVLYAGGGEDGLAISRQEADVLFDINDATVNADNDPSWRFLFSRAVAASIMMVARVNHITRHEAARREAWLNEEPVVSIPDFFGRMLEGGLRGIFKSVPAVRHNIEATAKATNAAEDRANRDAEVIDLEEAKWLIDRIGADGRMHENERELLRFISEESPEIAPKLRALIEQAA